eukprot:CAMPEP_0167756838 /NCGR_PEP_ID=MMETSP0110_2-20121227/9601_1 /TAXON_ID=629695 /ORGANISM="Gymnochlora sp., Strain CCMP2014" /LENGTH=338 /DNA_ID=CAMNT_0007642979 /DNA_START=66 /DNA_END=1085 /DNA_ORIENTATION=+
MAGANGAALALAVAKGGGLGSLPCALLSPSQMRDEFSKLSDSEYSYNANFFCHRTPPTTHEEQDRWKVSLAGYYQKEGVEPPDGSNPIPQRRPFDEESCEIVEEFAPRVVSFHFGLPSIDLLERVKNAGCTVMSSATTVDEAKWLEDNGADIIVAMGYEAGGHRGIFLDSSQVATQPGLMALLPQVVDSVNVPVVAAGGIMDARGIAAAMILGASVVQIGTRFLFSSESTISTIHRKGLDEAGDNSTTVTNIFSGKPARGIMNEIVKDIGPLSEVAPVFPTAGAALAPLVKQAEADGRSNYSTMWCGQGVGLHSSEGRKEGAEDITVGLTTETLKLFK